MQSMSKQILHDNIMSWEILGLGHSCGIILEESLPAIQSVCLDPQFFPQALNAISNQNKELLKALIPPSALHLFLVGEISGLLEKTSLIASRLLQRRLFSRNLPALCKLYAFYLTEFGLSPQQVQEIVQQELNAEPLPVMESEIASLEAELALPLPPTNLKIEFYRSLAKELSSGTDLMKSVEIAAGPKKEWCDLFSNLNQGEDALKAQMQHRKHTLLEQLFVIHGLRKGALEYALSPLMQAMETQDRLLAHGSLSVKP